MKTIRTAGGSFLTGTEIADAVTAYGLALARARDLDVVDIPFVTEAGSVSRAQFRIGWLIDTVVTAGQQSDGRVDRRGHHLRLARQVPLAHRDRDRGGAPPADLRTG